MYLILCPQLPLVQFGLQFRLALVAGFVACIAAAAPVSADETNWLLPENLAHCLIENREAYLEQPGDIIIIIVDQCPDPSPFAGALSGLQSYRGVSVVQTEQTTDVFDTIISYTPQALSCLRLDDIRFEDGMATMPKAVRCED